MSTSPTPTPVPFFDVELDVTPSLSFSTVQFDDETVNTVVNAILAALIVANLGSVVHKLINVTDRNFFCYRDYLRAMLFNSSDDLARIVGWLGGSRVYTGSLWKTLDSKVRWKRLIIPGCARIFVLFVTFLSIALTLPEDRRFKLCETRDFAPDLEDRENPDPTFSLPSVCADITLSTRRGTANSRLAYCSFQPASIPSRPSFTPDESAAQGLIDTAYDPGNATVSVVFQSGGAVAARQFYTEWTMSGNTTRQRQLKYRSLFTELDTRVSPNLALRAIRVIQPGCVAIGSPRRTNNGVRQRVSCAFNVNDAQKQVDPFFRAALVWRPRKSLQPRLIVPPDGRLSVGAVCPIQISVNRPIMNMLPMGLLLVIVFQLNLAVSLTLSQHGNVDDAAFHLMKEAVGVDVSSNPLQRTEGDRDHDFKLLFRTVHCSNGVNAHAGFLNTSDCVNADFDAAPQREVTRCIHSENRLTVAKYANASADGSSMNLDTASSRRRAPRY